LHGQFQRGAGTFVAGLGALPEARLARGDKRRLGHSEEAVEDGQDHYDRDLQRHAQHRSVLYPGGNGLQPAFYPPNLVEGVFSEVGLPLNGVLRSSSAFFVLRGTYLFLT
jgi:hypothetical protein